eukprot:9940502-Alexandrium_andersonii.AAC.1
MSASLVGSEMCIRDRRAGGQSGSLAGRAIRQAPPADLGKTGCANWGAGGGPASAGPTSGPPAAAT